MSAQQSNAIAVLRRASQHLPNEVYVEALQAIDSLEWVLEEAARRADGAGNLRELRQAIHSARGVA